jgi:hypothetical protein
MSSDEEEDDEGEEEEEPEEFFQEPIPLKQIKKEKFSKVTTHLYF